MKSKVIIQLHKNQFKDESLEISADVQQYDLVDQDINDLSSVSYIEQSWYRKSLWLWLLWPLSLLTKYISKRKREKFISQPDSSWKANVPLIVVGNIVIGGTEKLQWSYGLRNCWRKMVTSLE